MQEDDRFVGLRDLLPEPDYERSMRPLDGLMPMEIEGILSDCEPWAFLQYLYCVAISIVSARVKRRFSSAQVFAFFDNEDPSPDLLRFPNEICDDEDEFEAVLTALKLEPEYVAVLRGLFRAGEASDEPGLDPLSVGENFLLGESERISLSPLGST